MTDLPTITTQDTKRAARNATGLILASFLSKGILFLWQIVLGNVLSDADYGAYGAIIGLLAIGASFASFSMGLIVIREVAKDYSQSGKYWTATLAMQTGLAIFAYLGIVLIANTYEDPIPELTLLAGLSIFIDLYGNIGYDLLIARESMIAPAIVDIVHIIVRITLAAILLWLGYGLVGIYLAAIVTGVGRVIVLWLINILQGYKPASRFDRTIAGPLFRNSAPLALASVLWLTYQHVDKLMTTGMLGQESNAWVTGAFVISFGVVEVLSTTILVATYPMMSRYYMDGENPTFGFMIEKLALFMFLVSMPIALVISIYAENITIVFGADKAPQIAAILRILIWYTMIAMIGNVFQKGMLIQNRQTLYVVIRAVGLVINVTLNFIFLNQFGDPRGVAVASIIAESIVVGLMIWNFRAVGWSWSKIAPAVIRVIVYSIGIAIVMLILREFSFIVGAVVGLSLYFGSLLYGGVLHADDLDLIYRLVDAMPFGFVIQRYWKRDVAG